MPAAAAGRLAGLCAALAMLVSASASRCEETGKQGAAIPLGQPAATRFNHDFRSWRELKNERVVMQRLDYSCGAAALATIMRFYFEDKVTEAELLEQMLKPLDKKELEDREKRGFSMNDLFEAAKRRGYQATVYNLGLEKLKKLEAPVVIRLIKDDYKHFVVYRGYIEDRIFLADPLRGNTSVKAEDLARQWNGVALIMGKTGFGLPKEHGLSVSQPEVFRAELQAARRYLYTKP